MREKLVIGSLVLVLILAGVTLDAALEKGAADDILIKQLRMNDADCYEARMRTWPVCTTKHKICLVMAGEKP